MGGLRNDQCGEPRVQSDWRSIILVSSLHTGFEAETIALMLCTVIALCLTQKYWIEDQAFLRASTEILLFGVVALLLDRSGISIATSTMWILATIFTAGWRVEW
jgi:hypothetical protein